MPKHAHLSTYQRRLDDAPDPADTSAATEYQNCRDFIDSTLQENDGSSYADGDPRDNFSWHVTELHDNRLLFEVPHSELPTFTLRWPDADITFIDVREPLPDDYYDNHDRTNLNYYTTFVLDFTPYDAAPDAEEPDEDDTDDSNSVDLNDLSDLLSYRHGPYFIGA